LSGGLTINGNLTVTGTQFIADIEEVQIEDNLMLLNKNETGAGVTAGTAGLEIERGTATNYQFLFHEATDTFRVGLAGDLQAVATRQDTPTLSGVAYWNDTNKRFDTESGFTVQDIATKDYLSEVFANKYEITTTSGTTAFSTDFDIDEDAMAVYIDGVRQKSSAYTVSGREITLSETVVSGTELAVVAMEADAVQAMSAKADKVSGGTTGNLIELSATGNLVDAGVSADSVIEVVNTFSRKNVIINGNMDVWQRGTSFTGVTGAQFGADRFEFVMNGPSAVVTVNRGTSVPSGKFGYSFRVTPTTADSSIASGILVQLDTE
jgi:hypothetical protein